jgi:hypothetical protein
MLLCESIWQAQDLSILIFIMVRSSFHRLVPMDGKVKTATFKGNIFTGLLPE